MEPAQVDIDLGFFPLQFILFLITPWLSINGQQQPQRWGVQRRALAPGRYTFEAWYNWLWRRSVGTITVDLAPGALYRLRYRTGWFSLLPGKFTVLDPPLPPATARQLPPSL